jgi:hypothetical protein
MGMDVVGREPTTEEGEYFCNNVWFWRPLATYVCSIAPDLTAKCKHWQSNDGDGLNAADSRKLADLLQTEIDSGRTASYQRCYESELARMPKELCDLCEGTGTRKLPPARGAGAPPRDGLRCNACDGEGYREPWAKGYPFEVRNVQKFVTFLRSCGGFKIY